MGLKDILEVRRELTSKEKTELFRLIQERFLKTHSHEGKKETSSAERILADIRCEVKRILSDRFPDVFIRNLDSLTGFIYDSLFGLGLIEPLLREPGITDILVNNVNIMVVRNGVKEELPERFSNLDEVKKVIDRIASRVGRRIDIANPYCDCELHDGSRCHIIIPPVADGIYLTIRKLGCMNLTLSDWVKQQILTRHEAKALQRAVRERKNILISGGTGAGKTTLLNSLAKLIHEKQIIVTIEDTYELQLPHRYVRRLLTREESVEGIGEVSFQELLKNALRMNPDRLIMGEVRDESAYDLLHALNIGHCGSLSTIHANSVFDALWRLETLALARAPHLSLFALKRQIARVIDVIVQLQGLEVENGQIKKRKMAQMAYLADDLSSEGEYVLIPLDQAKG